MSINPEIQQKFKTNPLGITVSIFLTFILLYYLQSTVGPFASNATIRQNMVNFWDNSNWILKIVWPMLGAFLVLGFLLDDQRVERLRPIAIRIAARTARQAGRRIAGTRPEQFTRHVARRGERVIRESEEELEEFEEGPV